MKKKRKVKRSGVKVTVNVKPPVVLGKLLKTPVSKRATKFPGLGIRDSALKSDLPTLDIWQTAQALQTK